MADSLLTLFTNRIADLQQSSRDIVESYHAIRASMFAPDITIPSLEAKEMELLGCVERLEAKGQEVETLLEQVDINTAGQLIRSLPMFRDVSEAEGRSIILEYCEDVRMKFSWMGPRALAIKRTMAAQTVQQIKMRTLVGA